MRKTNRERNRKGNEKESEEEEKWGASPNSVEWNKEDLY
jgi:hypothetical protein